MRGPGELLGTRQTGLAELRVADLIRDADLLPQVRSTAELLLRENAACIAPLRVRWIGGARNMAGSVANGCYGVPGAPWLRRTWNYAQLMRLDRPIGIFLLLWPTLWALWIASGGTPPLKLIWSSSPARS